MHCVRHARKIPTTVIFTSNPDFDAVFGVPGSTVQKIA